MTIVEYIETIATALGMTFVHGTKAWQNLNDEKTEGENGFLYLDEPITSNDTLHQSGFIEAAYPLKMLFLKKNNLGDDPDALQTPIQAMRTQARKAIITMQNDKDNVRFVTNASRVDVMNVMDMNLSGCILEVTVTPRDNSSICV